MGVMVIPILQLYYLQAQRIIMKAQMSSSVDVAGVRDFNKIAPYAVRNAPCVEGFENMYL
jgi:hypothetical protein